MFDSKKEKVTSKEIVSGLWELCRKFSKEFYLTFRPVAEKIGIKFDADSEIDFSREIIMMDMWIISKALGPDKKVLDELHKVYLFGHSNMATTEKEKAEFPKLAEKELHERYKKYYEAWDDDAGGNQFILAITMLEYILNQGRPNKKLVNAALTFPVITHILAAMRTILEFRKDFETTDS